MGGLSGTWTEGSPRLKHLADATDLTKIHVGRVVDSSLRPGQGVPVRGPLDALVRVARIRVGRRARRDLDTGPIV